MYAALIAHDADETVFREVARRCLAAGVSPREVAFTDPTEAMLLPALPERDTTPASFTVPRAYADLLRDAVCHRAPERFALLYDVLWRIAQGERGLVARAADPAIARLTEYAHNVRRDIHKMHAFLRFRARTIDGVTFYTAWFEPQNYILPRAVPFFVDRFAAMDWLIATPIGTASWRGRVLTYGPPAPRPETAEDDVLDDLWLAYYRTTFNPARVRLKAMTSEMPKHYWSNMPETSSIPAMVADASRRVAAMDDQPADAPELFAERIAARGRPVPDVPATPIAQLRAEAATCRRCPLHRPATQTVFGEGPEDAALVFVGEQPGDQEDLAGRPFVGPAGEVFDRAFNDAGIARETVYVTNAVKHFKYEPRGKKRIHQRPNAGEVHACKWWLERELATIRPALVVALGATAAHALAGRSVSVLRARGPAEFCGRRGYITVHPSFLLRLPDEMAREAEYAKFVADLREIRSIVAAESKAAA
jgi:DNA polymerase